MKGVVPDLPPTLTLAPRGFEWIVTLPLVGLASTAAPLPQGLSEAEPAVPAPPPDPDVHGLSSEAPPPASAVNGGAGASASAAARARSARAFSSRSLRSLRSSIRFRRRSSRASRDSSDSSDSSPAPSSLLTLLQSKKRLDDRTNHPHPAGAPLTSPGGVVRAGEEAAYRSAGLLVVRELVASISEPSVAVRPAAPFLWGFV